MTIAESGNPKLYEVHVEFTFYALADSRRDAESYVGDAFNDEDCAEIADASEVTARSVSEWPGDSLVYGAEKDTTLDAALVAQGLPSVAELKAAWRNRLMPKAPTVSCDKQSGETK